MWLTAFVVIGFMQYRLVMAIHEATHKNLFFPVAVNEVVGKGLSGLLGMNFLLYRKSHLQHHKAPQKIGEDVDAPLYSPPLRIPPGLPRAWALLSGVVVSLFRKVLCKFTTRAQFGVPFYNLRKLSKLLQEHEPGYLQPIRCSYLAVLWEMINAEPKVPHPAAKVA